MKAPSAPTPEELAAIVAAIELCWPRPVLAALPPPADGAAELKWRFSGRWWSRPVPSRRERPY